MELRVDRLWKNDVAVTGVMYCDGKQKFFTLELPETYQGQSNVPDKTCIPAGSYNVVRSWSNHFGQMMPFVQNVPGRTAIEIHYGNYPHDVLGCILVGHNRINDAQIGNSREAFEEFMDEFDAALANNETITLQIS